MDRDIEKDLLHWKQQAQHLPILLRGARQVGKSYVVEKFGREHFANLVIVNFELQPELSVCFETLNPHEIIQTLSLLMHQKIEPEKTLLFLEKSGSFLYYIIINDLGDNYLTGVLFNGKFKSHC